jgi:hypothetical protein
MVEMLTPSAEFVCWPSKKAEELLAGHPPWKFSDICERLGNVPAWVFLPVISVQELFVDLQVNCPLVLFSFNQNWNCWKICHKTPQHKIS